MDSRDEELDERLRDLIQGVSPADKSVRLQAWEALAREIRAETSTGPRRRFWPGRGQRLFAAAVALVIGSGALAAANELTPVFRSGSDKPLYSLEPVPPGFGRQLQAAAEAAGGKVEVTTGDLRYCQRQEAEQRLDPGCELMLQAYRQGDVSPAPGPVSAVHVIPCGQKPIRGEVENCGSEIAEDDLGKQGEP
jgi:hypothetical protein